MLIRPLDDADWPRVHDLLVDVASEGETYALDVPTQVAQSRDFWVRPAVVAQVDGEVLGTAKMGPNRPAQGSHIGTASFLVASSSRGRGVGRALGEYVVQWHREQGFAGIQFNAVVESNLAAVRLWQSLGFQIIGTVPGAFRRPGGDLVGMHVMFLDLT